MKKNPLAVAVSAAALLFAANAWADGGPEPEAPPPPPPSPEPAPEPSPAHEPEPAPEYDWYTTVFAGAAFGDDLEETEFFGAPANEVPLKTGYLLGWTLGYDDLFGGGTFGVRPEVELSFRQQDVDLEDYLGGAFVVGDTDQSVPTDVLSLLGNLWFDLALSPSFDVYAGGGAGVGWADMPTLPITFPSHVESTDFVWQFGGGFNFNVSPRVFLGVGYRYFGGNFDSELFGSDLEHEYRSHEVLGSLGVRF